MKVSATGAAAAMIGTGTLLQSASAENLRSEGLPNDTKELFKKCGACSHTFYFILNREFGYTNKSAEIASDPLAGGMMLGHQCGMLWGSSLAVGAEAFRRNSEEGMAVASAITATGTLMDSFKERTKSVLCRDVVGSDVSKPGGIAKMMVKIIFQGGMKNSTCFKLADKWAPEAIKASAKGLSVKQEMSAVHAMSCASEVVRKMGGSHEEMVTVAGLAGGMGLKGHACGALGAALWMNTYSWCKKHPGQTPPKFNKANTQKIMDGFFKATNAESDCRKISGKNFSSINDHTEFLKLGGCSKLIDILASLSIPSEQ
jgi:hypothetical protein